MEIAWNTCRLCMFHPQSYQPPHHSPFRFPSLYKLKSLRLDPKGRVGFLGLSCSRVMASSSPPPPSVKIKQNIDLAEKEKKIFERLLQVRRHFNLQTQLRVAGGWVRDKLLGKDCYDIDIALDNMLGREFCEKVNEYLSHTGEEKQGIGVIQCNPDQSKHLETARMRLFDLWIDFVNLRSENYTEDSRIPTMKFGTAEEDAYRRDLTINSLFYNINTSSVEDFTGRGIRDLESGMIVTPLPPKETFLDDPLRVLRAVRFGARFEFMLDDELKNAASSDEVKAAIAEKISRERIGHEIDLMISGNQPVKAMSYICDLQLFWIVFNFPQKTEPAVFEGRERICIAYMGAAWSLLKLIGCSTLSDGERRLYLYAALFLPFRNTSYTDKKGKSIPVVNSIFRNSLKLKVSDAEAVVNIHSASERFGTLNSILVSNEGFQDAEVDFGRENLDVPVISRHRILAGLLLREIKGYWRVALLLSTLYMADFDRVEDLSNSSYDLDARRKLYRAVENVIIELGLEKVWETKPLINGKDIMSVLHLKSGGPLVKEWQQKVLEWQLAHPSGTADECLDWMKQTHAKRAKLE